VFQQRGNNLHSIKDEIAAIYYQISELEKGLQEKREANAVLESKIEELGIV
jgi:peptidoglycan hydrolase CwlO-like protein